jgi:hypothetical protein
MFGIIAKIRSWHRRRVYRSGTTVTRFLAPDIQREVRVLDTSELEEGFITARVRTWNLLYAEGGRVEKPDFGEPERVCVDSLWNWTGEPWGGPVPRDSDEADAGD